MLSKLLKKDLKRNMSWMWILLVTTITISILTRGCNELGKNLAFFNVVSIFLDTIFYSLLANSIIQPFLRSFLNFSKSMYGDESYLTHTLPVTKSQIINSKFLTTIIEILLSFSCVIISLLIRFASPAMFSTLKVLLQTAIVGEFSVILAIILVILLIIVEFIMFISIIYFAIVTAYKSKDKRVLKSFLITGLMSLMSFMGLSIIMVIVFLINNVDLSTATVTLSSSIFMSILISGIIFYSLVSLLFYYLTKKEFNKGVNVD